MIRLNDIGIHTGCKFLIILDSQFSKNSKVQSSMDLEECS